MKGETFYGYDKLGKAIARRWGQMSTPDNIDAVVRSLKPEKEIIALLSAILRRLELNENLESVPEYRLGAQQKAMKFLAHEYDQRVAARREESMKNSQQQLCWFMENRSPFPEKLGNLVIDQMRRYSVNEAGLGRYDSTNGFLQWGTDLRRLVGFRESRWPSVKKLYARWQKDTQNLRARTRRAAKRTQGEG